jgi:hypothetical protein
MEVALAGGKLNKNEKINIMMRTLLYLMLAAGCGSKNVKTVEAPIDEKPPMIQKQIKISSHSVQFYIDFASDSAVLGFSVENDSGKQRYFPLYASTYRGLPTVRLDIFVSDSQEEMWVLSSWPGYETLAFYRIGTDHCTTRYGEIKAFDKPTPESLGAGTSRFPEMNIEKVTKLVILEYDGKQLNKVN